MKTKRPNYDFNKPRTVQDTGPETRSLAQYWGLNNDYTSAAGVYIDETVAQNISTVYSCITLIAQTLASLPIGCFRKKADDDREAVDQHPAWWIFNKSPDDVLTSYMARETFQGHLLLRGNAYFELVRNFRGQAVDAYLLDPRKMSVVPKYDTERNSEVPEYHYSPPKGSRVEYDRSELLHFANWSTNGYLGIAPLTLFRESMGLTVAANRYASNYFVKGGHPLGFLTRSRPATMKEKKEIQADWLELHGGVENSHNVGFLTGDMDWKNIGMSNNDAQLLGLRQFQKYELASVYRVPPFLIGDVEQPLSNIEFILIQFLIFTLLPWMKRHESEMNKKLFTRMEQFSYYMEYNADALLRGDAKSRSDAFQTQARNGALLIDEWRRMENRPKLPDGMGQVPMIMASQIAKLEDVISGKVNLDTTNKTSNGKGKVNKNNNDNQIYQLADEYSKLNEHDRNRLKGLIISMNGVGVL